MSAMTLRLSGDLDERLRLVAEVLGLSVSDAVRMAVEEFVRERLTNEGFRTQVQMHIDQMARLLS